MTLVIRKRVFTPQDVDSILESWPRMSIPNCPGRALLIDIPPTQGALHLCRELVSRGWKVVLRDHHLPEGDSARDQEIRALSQEIANVISNGIERRVTRSQHPGCSTLVLPGEWLAFDLVVADADPDGLLSSMVAMGLDYPGLHQDCAVLDGAPELRSRENLTELGWLLNQCWCSLEPRDSKKPEIHEAAVQELFSRFIDAFIDAVAGYQDAGDWLREKAARYDAMVEAATEAAVLSEPVGSTGWFLVDLVGKRVDRGTLTRLLEERGATVVVSKLDSGVIAGLHGGVQYSAATTSLSKGQINLTTLKPDDLVSSPESGVISNVPFLLHMSQQVWDVVKARLWFPGARVREWRLGSCGDPPAVYSYLEGYHRGECNCGWEGPTLPTKEEAIAAWNTRPIEDALRAEVAELREELETAERERDEARAEVELYAEAMDKGPEWSASETMLALNEEVARECDRANRAECERDELRAEVERLREAIAARQSASKTLSALIQDEIRELREELTESRRERDEARGGYDQLKQRAEAAEARVRELEGK